MRLIRAVAVGCVLLLSLAIVAIGAAQPAQTVVITGVMPNHSSVRVFYQPVPGAQDYRVYDVSVPTNVKYAGLVRLTPSSTCPGSGCFDHFVTSADGVTPVFPYRVASGATGGVQVLDVPSTEIEWNSLMDAQSHTLVVEAVDQLGPVPQANLYVGAQNVPLVSSMPAGAMLGSNKGRTSDGNTSTNGQGPYPNAPQAIARSQPFIVQAQPSLTAIPTSPGATQSFFDTFENTEGATIKQLARQDSATDSVGNLGSMTYRMNAGTAKEWTIEYRQADNQDSMPFISSDHFMDMLFDGATPNTSAPTHTTYGSMSMTPRPTVDMSSGQMLHLTMEVDAHQSFRRWLAFDLAPAADPLQGWNFNGQAINNADQGLFLEIKDGGCTLDIFTGPKSQADPQPTGTAGGPAHGARLWGGSGSTGGAPISCGWDQMYNPAHFSKNGLGLDDRSRFDFFVTQDHAAFFEDGQLILQSDIPAGSFPWANVPLRAYYTHYLYHSDADVADLHTFNVNGQTMCYPANSYWFNVPLLGTVASQTVCNISFPAGYGFPYSDERHWDNMGFEVLPPTTSFAGLAALVQLPTIQKPVFQGTPPVVVPTPTVVPQAVTDCRVLIELDGRVTTVIRPAAFCTDQDAP